MKQILSKIDVNPVVPISNRRKNSQSEIDTTSQSEIDTTSQSEIDTTDLCTILDDRIIYPNLKLTAIGEIVENVIIQISNYSKLVEIDSYVIMPNHIHLVIFLFDDVVPISNRRKNGQSEIDTTSQSEIGTTRPSIPSIVRFLKSSVTKQCKESIFQQRYYDEILRDEKHYQNVSSYVLHNPVNWINDKYYEKS